MVPRKYISDDAESLSAYIGHSQFNEFLLDGLLTYENNHPDRPLTREPLQIFNEVYYYANRIMFEPFPELKIRDHYIEECMEDVCDLYTRDVIMSMLYVVLDRMENQPGKVVRFCNQMQIIYPFHKGYMDEIIAVSNDCDNNGIWSNWDWTPPAVSLYSVFGATEDWREATDGFQYENIESFYNSADGIEDKFYVIKDIYEQFDAYQKEHPDEFTREQVRKVWYMYSAAEFAKKKVDKEREEQKKREEEAAKAAAEPDVPSLSEKESELQGQLAERDAEIQRLNKDIEHKNAYIREHNGKESELASKLRISEDLVAELREQLESFSVEDENDEPDERTQKVVTNYLFSILKKAGMGNETTDYNKTDVSELIHYITGFSSNTIRQTLTYPRLTSAAEKEVKKAAALLKKVNLDISIK